MTREQTRGAGEAGAAFTLWGLTPLMLAALAPLGVAGTISWRVVLSAASLVLAPGGGARARGAAALLRGRALRWTLASSALLLANWVVFIFACQGGLVLQVSLGYYLIPLANALLGLVILRQPLSRTDAAALAFSAAAVAAFAAAQGGAPWLSLFLVTTFPLYGALHRASGHPPLESMLAELAVALPFALAFVGWTALAGRPFGAPPPGAAGLGAAHWAALAVLGPLSALPLALFHSAARRISYAAVGFLSNVGPTIQLALAVLFFGEAFSAGRLGAFALMWVALAVFTAGRMRDERRRARLGARRPAA